MKSSIGLDGMATNFPSSFDFDISQFNLDDFDSLGIQDGPKHLDNLKLPHQPDSSSGLNGTEPSKQLSEPVLSNSTEPHTDLTQRKKPKKGILKPYSPPETFAKRSSTLFRLQKEKLIGRLSLLNRGESYTDLDDPFLREELHPRELKRVRFSFPLGTTSIILPDSCKLSPPTSLYSPDLDSAPDPAASQIPLLHLIDGYLFLCRSREELPSDRFIKLLEEAKTTQLGIDSINMSAHEASLIDSFFSKNDFRESLSIKTIHSFADGIDLLSGLTRLELEGCNLDDECVKVLCGNFLLSDRLLWLSLANNPKVRSDGFKFIATYINQSKSLKYLDLSCTVIDTKAAKYLARGVMSPLLSRTSVDKPGGADEVATPVSPTWADASFTEPCCCLEELRLNECSLRSVELKIICQGLSHTKLRSLSLCGNRISYLGAAALASLLKVKAKVFQVAVLDLNLNQLKTSGLEQLLLPLSDPQSRLQELNLGSNGIDELGMAKLFAALVGVNMVVSVVTFTHRQLLSLKTCLSLNHNLRALFLSDTNMASEGAIALAEVLPESKSLVRLDISQNGNIGMAGLLALSVSARLNYSITCLEVSIPPNDPELSSLSQGMLSTCIRNTQLGDDLKFGERPSP
ncbi:hypothetical protein L0F63_002312 [Massospora cicadina]|nr:hypothetical protein L0F63_002312 [Massospora cicadina]